MLKPQVVVIWSLTESESLDVAKINCKLSGHILAKLVNVDKLFALSNLSESFSGVLNMKPHPWQLASSEEVGEKISQSLQVIPPTLLHPQVSIDRHVPHCAWRK